MFFGISIGDFHVLDDTLKLVLKSTIFFFPIGLIIVDAEVYLVWLLFIRMLLKL